MTILLETKIRKAKFVARSYRGYTIRVSPSGGKNCGGVGLQFTVENAKAVVPNVISFQLLLTRKDERWHMVGYYSPPSNKEGAMRRLAMEALDAAPEGSKPLLIGDLNAGLDFPRDR